MELLNLSKFKLQLQALVAEVRDLREKEHYAAEQCRLLIQKQKQTEEECGRKLQELQAELASSNELEQKLERKVSYLQNDNALLEEKHKELKATIQSLLQSRDSFINAYQESTFEMKRTVEDRERKIGVLSEKISSHLSLFDFIEKESCAIKGVTDDVQRIVSEKEEVVTGLRSKMDRVCAFEKISVEKIRDLENKLKNNEDESQRKDRIISQLEARLDAAEVIDSRQAQIDELQKTLLAKDVVIQNLISEKEGLHSELGSLAITLQKIQETVKNMNEEDKRVFSSVLKCHNNCELGMPDEDDRIDDMVHNSGEASPDNAYCMATSEYQASPLCQGQKHQASPLCQGQNSVGNPQETIHLDSCVSELACTPPHSPSSELQSAANGASILVKKRKVYRAATATSRHLESECSTTETETSQGPS